MIKRVDLLNSDNFKISQPSLNKEETTEKAKEAATMMDAAISNATSAQDKRIRDGLFNNSMLKLGMSDPALGSAEFTSTMLTFDRMDITNIYHGLWIFRRIIDKVAQDMWSSGITINGDTNPDDLKKIYTKLGRLRSKLIWATEQARLYGGAASLIMVDDGEDDLSKPLNLRNIKKGSKINLFTTDRWYGLEQSQEKVTNYKSIDFATPKYYTFILDELADMNAQSTSSVIVHHSRVLRFVNRKSVRLMNQKLSGWGISEIEHIYQDLMGHENTKSSAVSLVQKSLLEILKLEGMRGTMQGISMGNSTDQSLLTAQLTAINNFRTNNLILLDKEDEYTQQTYTFQGLSELLDTQKDTIAGAAEMPKVLLYGDTKGGLSSDSPAEMEFYAGTILGKQDEMLRPVLDKLLPILYRIVGVEIPTDLDYDFESIAGLSQDKKINLLQATISAANDCVENGYMTHETALNEILQVQKMTGFGSNIDDKDKELAKKMDEEKDDMSDGEETEPTENIQATDDYTEIKDKILGDKKLRDKWKKKK